MAYGEAEDAGGPAPAKDNNETARHFIRRTLTILECVDYIQKEHLLALSRPKRRQRGLL